MFYLLKPFLVYFVKFKKKLPEVIDLMILNLLYLPTKLIHMYELILSINMLYDIRQLRKKRIAALQTVYLFVSTLCIKAYWLIHSIIIHILRQIFTMNYPHFVINSMNYSKKLKKLYRTLKKNETTKSILVLK